jgi:hypothetical protein
VDDDALKRIRIISERFVELQGLRVALAGSLFAAVFGTYLIAEPPHGEVAIWIAMAVCFGFIIPGELWVRRYYASTFGRLSPKRAGSGSASGVAKGLVLGAGLVVVDKVFGVPAPAGTFLPLTVFALWIGIRDWPLRRHHFVAAAASGCAFLIQTTPQAASAPDMAIAAGFLLFGAVYVPVGLLDHRLLVSAMRGATGDAVASTEEPSA